MRNLTHSRRPKGLLITFVALILAACAGAPPVEAPPPQGAAPDTAAIQQLADEGRFLDAALAYSRLAHQAATPQREAYTLAAAEYLLQGNYVPQAHQMLQEIDVSQLDTALQIRKALLAADIALARQLPEQALATLDPLEPAIAAQPSSSRARFHRLRARAFALTGNQLEMARERIRLEPLLATPEEIQANQEAILSGLQTLSPAALTMLRTSPPPDELSGWLELAMIGKEVGEAAQGPAELVTWRERYPDHPALDAILSEILAARPQALPRPRQIALILPLRGRFAKAADAIRDGFLAAYYAQPAAAPGADLPSTVVPDLRIYDEGDAPANIDQVYQQAVDDGAQFVVGPLDKDAVTSLAHHEPLPVPVLALNYREGPAAPPPDNFFQLSLSPEQEARQVAERAWLDGHRRAVVITPDSDWGRRVAKAFHERWLQLGGHVVEAQHYDVSMNDYSLPIRRLLNVDESDARFRAVRALAPQKVEFIPRRRQDIDFVFMAAFPRQARLIRPQLRFHHAAKVPVYATSHVYDGNVNREMDRDMDGVMFADMPWTLAPQPATDDLKAEIAQLWPNEATRYPRLYALGVDAYRVIGQLNTLRSNRAAFYPGETGDLYLDMANRLQRRLLWARFEHGIPQLLQEYHEQQDRDGPAR
jgi:outer membrane PBP1 activator LpoA protein